MTAKIGIRITVLLLILLILLGGGAWWWNDAVSALDPEDTSQKIFVISPGENVRAVASRLRNEGFIKDQIGFFLTVRLKGFDEKIQAGDFRLSPSMDIEAILEELTHGTLDVWVTTLEGWRVEEIAMKLAQELAIPESELLKYTREGYLFPDTYLIPKDASASAVVEVLLNNFDARVTDDIRAGIQAQGMTFEEGIVMASIVEREGRTDTDRPMIAGILLKRLRNDWPLQADATLQYALGYQSEEKTWWKKTLYNTDKEIDSPYNTYKKLGLPPTPISNPGLGAIKAVAFPTQSDYWYYLHSPDGQIYYGATLEEHEENIEKYLR